MAIAKLIWWISALWRFIGPGNENSATIMLKLILKMLKKAVQKEKYIFSLGLTMLVLWPFLVLIGEKITDPFVILSADKKAQSVAQSIELEKLHALEQAKEIVASQIFDPYIESGDVPRLIALANEEKLKRGVTTITAVNKDGMALSRVPATANRGDYVFQTLPWGRAASRGQTVAAVGAGRSFPLTITGACPITREGDVEGAIFAGYWLNDDYAKSFRNKYLSRDAQVAFYSGAEGIVGDTFGSREKNLIKKYFNSGTDFVQKNLSNFLVRVGGEYYFVKNISLEGLEDSKPGGALVFLPRSPLAEGILFSLIISIFIFIAGIIIHRRHTEGGRPHRAVYALVVLCLVLFVASTAIYLRIFGRKAFDIKEPPSAIYNSVLKFEPEWGVVDIAAEQSVVIKLISGGEAINAAQANIEYDPSAVKVADVITTKSFCDPSFFLEKTIDNEKGLVTIACGRPGGFAEDTGILAELLVQPLKSGGFSLRFGSGTQVLAHDGLGTNILRQIINASFRVLSLSDAPTFPQSAQPLLFSSSHPNSERWYNARDVAVSWPRLSEKTRYVYAIDQNPDTALRSGKSVAENTLHIKTPVDGVYYIHMAAETEGKLGPTSHIKIRVDSAPPAPPSIKASNYSSKVGEVVRVEVSSSDEMSGLQKTYYYKVNEGMRLPFGRELAIPFQESGAYTLTARVFDNAGNFNDASVTIEVKK